MNAIKNKMEELKKKKTKQNEYDVQVVTQSPPKSNEKKTIFSF